MPAIKNISKRPVYFTLVNLLILSGLAVLTCYLLALRAGIILSECLFWISVGGTLSLLLLECFVGLEIKPVIVVAQLIILVFLLKSIYIPRNLVPFFGSDSYLTYEAISYIQKEGWFSDPPWDEKTTQKFAHQKNYPFVPALSLGLTTISGLDLVDWGRWGILSLSLTTILMIYDIANSFYNRRNEALIAAIGFGFTYYYLMFHTQFLYEAIAFFLFLITIYSVIRSSTGGINFGWRLIALASTEVLILTHHLTAFLLVVFLLLYNLVQLGFKKQQQWPLFLFALISLFTYWIFLRYTPFQIAAEFIRDVFKEGSWVTSTSIKTPHTFRFLFTLLLQGASAIMFGLLALHNLLFTPADNTKNWKIVSFLWGGGLGIITILGTIGLFGNLKSFPSRMEIYGYAFLIPLASQTLVTNKKFKLINLLLFLAILCHGTSTLFRTAPYLYSEREPDLSSGETRAQWLNQEYNLIAKIDPNLSGITGNTYRRLNSFFDLKSAYIDSNEGKTKLALDDFDYIVLGKQDQFNLSSNFQNVFASSTLNKVYDAGWAELYVKPFQITNWQINSLLDENQNNNELTIPSLPIVEFSGKCWDWLIAFSILFSLSLLGYLYIIWLTKRGYQREAGNTMGELGIGIFFCITLIAVSYLVHDYFQKISIPIALMCSLFAMFIVFSIFNNKRIKLNIFPGVMEFNARLSGYGQILKNLIPNVFLLFVVLSTLPLGALFQASTNPISVDPFIEFYLVRYSYSARNNSVNCTIGIKNHSVETKSFIIESTFDDIDAESYNNIIVRPGETVVQTFSHNLTTFDKNNSKAEFLLLSDKPSPVYSLSIKTGS